MATIKDNDPCPCGSSKKYKNCCGRKDPEKARTGRSDIGFEPQWPNDSHAAAKARWEEFEAADHEGMIALFRKTLDEGLMDEELAFEMLASIRPQARERCQRDRFETLLDMLEAEAPDLYSHDAPYYTTWRIEDALLGGNTAAIPSLLMIFADKPDQDLDEFLDVIDLLLYHGQAQALIGAMTAAWPKVEVSEKIVPWGIDEFSELLSCLIMYDYIEQTTDPRSDDPVLVELLAPYVETDPVMLAESLSALLGRSGRRWSMRDFGRNLGERRWDRNLFLFSLEFIGELHRRTGVPYSKGELGRDQLCRYLFKRRKGEYGGKIGLAETPRGRHRKPRSAFHPLSPERGSFDRFLAGLLHFLNHKVHKAGCAMELVPAWMDFLFRRGLITHDEAQKTLRRLSPLLEELVQVLGDSDPVLVRNLCEAWGYRVHNRRTNPYC